MEWERTCLPIVQGSKEANGTCSFAVSTDRITVKRVMGGIYWNARRNYKFGYNWAKLFNTSQGNLISLNSRLQHYIKITFFHFKRGRILCFGLWYSGYLCLKLCTHCNVNVFQNAVTFQVTHTIRIYDLNFHVPHGVTLSCEIYIRRFPVCYGSPRDVKNVLS
jgi:hypothetical protein